MVTRTITSGLNVTSELGRLRQAVIHSPGLELERVTPNQIGRMLMNDVLYLRAAQADHEIMARVLHHAGVQALQFSDLLRETLAALSRGACRRFIREVCALEGGYALSVAYKTRLAELSAAELTELCIVGDLHPESVARYLNQELYALAPLPNLMFLRDSLTVLGDGLILSHMCHAVRRREPLLWRWILDHHPHFEGLALWPPEASPLGEDQALEGGNFYLLRPDTLLIGCNERSSAPAIDRLARDLLLNSSSPIKTILVAAFKPDSPYYTHYLDTGFSLLDDLGQGGHVLLHHPMLAPEGAALTWLKLSADPEENGIKITALAGIQAALSLNSDDRLIYAAQPASITERVTQEREWYNQGLNLLALAPRKLLAFRRNRQMLAQLATLGYSEIPAEDFLNWEAAQVETWLNDPHTSAIISLPDDELARGHGGPRSLVLPLLRDDLQEGV